MSVLSRPPVRAAHSTGRRGEDSQPYQIVGGLNEDSDAPFPVPPKDSEAAAPPTYRTYLFPGFRRWQIHAVHRIKDNNEVGEDHADGAVFG